MEECKRVNGEFRESSFMERRIMDGRREETKVSERGVREGEAIAEEESWSGWNQVKEQVSR